MIGRIGFGLRKLRNVFSRSYWAVRLLGLTKSTGSSASPGLVLIQIDGLSFKHYQRGLREGNLPFLQALRAKQKYKDHSHYSGMPSNTPAVQGELFYGVKGCVPAFNFVDHQSGETFVMFDPKCAIEIENRISQGAEPLLKEGSSYSNIFLGGAVDSHYCAAGGGYSRLFKVFNPLTWLLILIFHLNIFIRTLFLILVETVLGVIDFVRGTWAGKKMAMEFKFILARSVFCVLLRELVAIGGKIDIARGLPVIHLNFAGYDEQAHWRGPSSKFAHWSLRGIDDAIARVWREAQLAERRDYDVWVYSDHGQEDSTPYTGPDGGSIEAVIEKIFGEVADAKDLKKRNLFSHDQGVDHASPKVIAVGMGPLVHIYSSEKLSAEETERVVTELLVTAKVPVVLLPKEGGLVEARTAAGTFRLPEEASAILGNDHPFLQETAVDLAALCHHPSAGPIIISGELAGQRLMTFASENGCHAGYGPEETHGFALLPQDAPLRLQGRAYLRPTDIREAALRHLDRTEGLESNVPVSVVNTLRVLTYNVHGCVGLDGKNSPDRIARVIARQGADVVALQELDVGRHRSGKIHQAESIAFKLGMSFHFQPSLSLAEGQYGNAILSRYPLKVIRVEALPRLKTGRLFEPRGALWVELDVSGIKVNVITSHLSLWPAERLLQADVLLGPDWSGGAGCQSPLVLCGDFNANPRSKVCQRMGRKLRDAQRSVESHEPLNTWLANHPFSRIDHFFVSPDVEVLNITVPTTDLDRIASDHLPLIADFKINSEKVETKS